jgi:hypothetical protein
MHPTLEALSKLEPGWDSYGADRILPAALAKAQATLDASDFEPTHIAPMRSGGLQFEYCSEAFEFELEFTPEGGIVILVSENIGDIRDEIEIHIPRGKANE